MNKQILLCVDASGLLGKLLQKGTVYTFLADETCSCGMKGHRQITVEEIVSLTGLRRCGFCGRVKRVTYLGFNAKRFIPLNDPEEKEKEELWEVENARTEELVTAVEKFLEKVFK